jgi:hypothetical protein
MMIQSHPGPAGLCEDCSNARIVSAKNGSRFYLCRLASANPLFPRYPRLPVLRCAGYTPTSARSPSP